MLRHKTIFRYCGRFVYSRKSLCSTLNLFQKPPSQYVQNRSKRDTPGRVQLRSECYPSWRAAHFGWGFAIPKHLLQCWWLKCTSSPSAPESGSLYQSALQTSHNCGSSRHRHPHSSRSPCKISLNTQYRKQLMDRRLTIPLPT